MRSAPSVSSRSPSGLKVHNVRRPTRREVSQPSAAVRMSAWRAAFSSTPSRSKASMKAAVHADPPEGSTNSPSRVNSNPRALSPPAACRLDMIGAIGTEGSTVNMLQAIDGQPNTCRLWEATIRGRAMSETQRVDFQAEPSRYRHWRVAWDGPVATVTMDVDPHGGLRPGYELKLNS